MYLLAYIAMFSLRIKFVVTREIPVAKRGITASFPNQSNSDQNKAHSIWDPMFGLLGKGDTDLTWYLLAQAA